MKWTDQQSIKLSKQFVYVLGLMILLVMLFMSRFIDWIVPLHAVSSANRLWFIVTLESCLGVALIILFFLDKLIQNIGNNQTFEEQNIRLLRRLSWLCFLETAILLVSSVYYFPWLFVAGITGFVGIIIRVIKNVFCQALLIKEENDFTI